MAHLIVLRGARFFSMFGGGGGGGGDGGGLSDTIGSLCSLICLCCVFICGYYTWKELSKNKENRK